MVIRNLLFDLDETLFDFHRAEAIALRRALTSLGVAATEEITARYSVINDSQWKRLELGEITRDEVTLGRFGILFREFGIDAPQEAMRDAYEGFLGEGHYYIEGAEALLDRLAPVYRLYLVSNGTARVQRSRIASAGLERYFREIFISQEIGHNKPDRAFFDFCFARIPEFSREETVIVGDSLTSDIRGGNNAGIRTCWFNPAGKENTVGAHVDWEIARLDELPGIWETL
ncbi:MAG: YjjG family noncanonical pyrimidine nucleotidase [Lachnospiraceae bacterium]|nr:YjjG family noncanonical pyrimidine nucleotidase [Lachnospiraceae bacterium]